MSVLGCLKQGVLEKFPALLYEHVHQLLQMIHRGAGIFQVNQGSEEIAHLIDSLANIPILRIFAFHAVRRIPVGE